MALLKRNKKVLNKPVPAIGVETVPLIGVDTSSVSFTEPDPDIHSRVAECAYYKAQARGFEPGHEVEDWLEAEIELTQ